MNTPFDLDNPATWTGVLLPILGALVALLVGWFVGQIGQRAVLTWVPRAGGNSGTIATLLGQAVRYSVFVLAIVTALGFLGFPSTSILTVVCAASRALALALTTAACCKHDGIGAEQMKLTRNARIG